MFESGRRIQRRMFAKGPNAIADAFAFAQTVGVAIVKLRDGNLRGSRHVYLCTPDGVEVTPQTIVDWSIRSGSPVGEHVAKTSKHVILALLERNKDLQTKLDLRHVDIPSIEPEEGGIFYSVRFDSGETRTVTRRPKADRKDTDGNVTIPGHKLLAFALLLEAQGLGGVADQARTVKYTYEGKVYVVSRSEALVWSEQTDQEGDEVLAAFRAAFEAGNMDADEYVERVALYRYDQDNPGRRAAQARYSEELEWAKYEGVLTEDAATFMAGWTHPAYRERRTGPTMWERKTRVQYGSDGRMVWQRARNSMTPGARWVGGQSPYEAMVYNL